MKLKTESRKNKLYIKILTAIVLMLVIIGIKSSVHAVTYTTTPTFLNYIATNSNYYCVNLGSSFKSGYKFAVAYSGSIGAGGLTGGDQNRIRRKQSSWSI